MRPSRKLALWPLVAATFFMVSGGTYGTEDIVHGAGYRGALLILLLTPLIWSLPTAFMIGELASALPLEGGFYAWVRRALGPFWGFQEAWLSLTASVFDMAIYPTLFVAYLERLFPWFATTPGAAPGVGHRGIAVGYVVIVVCALWNIAGIRIVAETSFALFLALTAPFLALTMFALEKHGALATATVPATTGDVGIVAGVLVAMWNYMGWDNASTIAAEVERPQLVYPRAMILAVLLVAASYIVPIAAMSFTGVPRQAWETGSWADLGALVAGPWLRVVIVGGGMLSAFGMFNALVMSYTRLPLAMALDGMLPRIFAFIWPRTGAPWISILVCSFCWAACQGLGFERLITIDVFLYGLSLLLEFAALVMLRVREPGLKRPFRVSGGTGGAALLGLLPMLLLGFAVVRGSEEKIAGVSTLRFGLLIVAAGALLYYCLPTLIRPKEALADSPEAGP